MKQRIKEYLKHNRITQKEFCNSIGVVQSYLSSLNKGIPQKKLMKIQQIYPDLNIDWLITGQGEMLREVKQNDNVQPALSGDMLAYLREKDNEIRELRARIDELTRELHEREIEIVELKKENLHVAKRADVAASSQKVG